MTLIESVSNIIRQSTVFTLPVLITSQGPPALSCIASHTYFTYIPWTYADAFAPLFCCKRQHKTSAPATSSAAPPVFKNVAVCSCTPLLDLRLSADCLVGSLCCWHCSPAALSSLVNPSLGDFSVSTGFDFVSSPHQHVSAIHGTPLAILLLSQS